MKPTFKIQAGLLAAIRADLARPHAYAYERVGFVTAGAIWTSGGDVVLVARSYRSVDDTDYVEADEVGAAINMNAMRKGMQHSYANKGALFHIHTHGGRGVPRFSRVDRRSGPTFVPSFFNLVPRMPHGLIVLSDDSADGLLWTDRHKKPQPLDRFVVVGRQLDVVGSRA